MSGGGLTRKTEYFFPVYEIRRFLLAVPLPLTGVHTEDNVRGELVRKERK